MYTRNLYVLNILWCFYTTNGHKINTDDGCIFQVAYITFMNEHTQGLVPIQNANARELHYSTDVMKWYQLLN